MPRNYLPPTGWTLLATCRSGLSGIRDNSRYAELGITSSLVHPREVFKAALLANSNGIIVAHNHPAGSLQPSHEDLEVTETLIKAGELMGVKLLDHIIVSSSGTRSLRETHGSLWF